MKVTDVGFQAVTVRTKFTDNDQGSVRAASADGSLKMIVPKLEDSSAETAAKKLAEKLGFKYTRIVTGIIPPSLDTVFLFIP